MVLLIWLLSLCKCMSVLKWRCPPLGWGAISLVKCVWQRQSLSSLWREVGLRWEQFPGPQHGPGWHTAGWLLHSVLELNFQKNKQGRLKAEDLQDPAFLSGCAFSRKCRGKTKYLESIWKKKYINDFRLAKGNCRLSRVMCSKSTCDGFPLIKMLFTQTLSRQLVSVFHRF